MHNPDAPIIVIGNGGSGSSLLDRILGAHPEITMLGETSFLVPDAWAAFGRAAANTSFRSLERHFENDANLEQWITSSPTNYKEFLELLTLEENKRRGHLLGKAMQDWFCLGETNRRFWGFKEIMNGGEWRYEDRSIYDYTFPEAT